MADIFISYRRADSGGHARNLYERLCARIGRDRVFLDVKGISIGQPWRQHLRRHLEDCRVVLAVIGTDWLGSRGEHEPNRLSDPKDIVRLELVEAGNAGKLVIPVLVGGASPPPADQVPESLQNVIVDRQWVRLGHETFDADVGQLEAELKSALPDLRFIDAAVAPSFHQTRIVVRAVIQALGLAIVLTLITNWYFTRRGVDPLMAPELAVVLVVWFVLSLTGAWLFYYRKRLHPL